MPGEPTRSTPARGARRSPDEPKRLRILAVALHTPLPADNGDSIRVLGLLRALAARHEVEFACTRRAVSDDDDVRRLSALVDGRLRLFAEAPRPAPGPLAAVGRWTRALLVGAPPWVRQHWNPAVAAFLKGHEGDHDVVVLLDNPAMIYASLVGEGAVTVADMHNVTGWSFAPTLATEPRRPGGVARSALGTRLTRRSERRAVAAVDGVIVTSQDEARRLTALYGAAPCAVIPSAIDLPPRPLRAAGSRTVGWLGGLRYGPNLDGLLRFVSAAWPPDGAGPCRLLIAGADPPSEVLGLGEREDIDVLGYVPDVTDFLAQVDVAVVPLWAGAGVKLKAVTFMGAGIPLVSTAIGVEGTGAVDGVHALVRERPAELAAGLRQLLDDEPLAQRLAESGRALVAERLTWSSVGADFADAVERIAGVR